MATLAHQALRTLIAKLESIAPLDAAERDAILGLPVRIRHIAAREDIVRDGDEPEQCCLLVDGWLFRYKVLRWGKRQILSFHVPGDMPDLQSLHLPVMDHHLAALAPATIAAVTHSDIRHLMRRHPHLAALFWRETLIDAGIFREWMTGLGRRDAYARAAHVLCETYVRLAAVGRARGDSFVFPVTQGDLADALGLTVVHMNRTLQAIRNSGLITWQGRDVLINDWAGLVAVADFDPAYLQLKAERRP